MASSLSRRRGWLVLLEKRIKATTVISIGPIMQAVCAMIVTHTWSYPLFAASGALMASTILFTHTYAFGLLARLDATGRAVADRASAGMLATPGSAEAAYELRTAWLNALATNRTPMSNESVDG